MSLRMKIVEFGETESSKEICMHKCKTCGYPSEQVDQQGECVECFVSRQEREGNKIALQHDLAMEDRYANEGEAA